jgi:hypothetical protein
MRVSPLLFNKFDSFSAAESQTKALLSEVDGYNADDLLTANVDALLDYFDQKYVINVPVLDESHIETSQSETAIPLHPGYQLGGSTTVAGTSYTFHVPYSGDKVLLECRPSSFTMNPPRAVIDDDELRFTFSTRDASEKERIFNEFQRHLADVRNGLATLTKDFASFNDQRRETARARIEARRQKLLSDRGTAASFGFRVRERPGAPRTYSVPTARKASPALRPPAGKGPYRPEPALDLTVYEHILEIVANMARVLEQSPSAFAGMHEEQLRDHFLVQLNGQYEGSATGETFNVAGKTDILIKLDGKNIFIAECKFYEGPKSITDAMDQLLRYATWRDTKLAILVFYRGPDVSAVLAKIREAMRTHTNTKRMQDYASETGCRATLAHPDDTERELLLTALVFPVPTAQSNR